MHKRLLVAALSLLFAAGLFMPLRGFAGEPAAEGAASGEESAEAAKAPETENVLVIKNLNTGISLPLKSGKSRAFRAGVAARLMTALAAYEEIEDLNTRISVPFCASDPKLRGDGSYIGFSYSEADDAMTLEELLTAALVSSATDACLTLAVAAARHKAGESMDCSHNYRAAAEAAAGERAHINDFVEAMNGRARSLGCRNTLFTNCTGVADAAGRTTAEDIALIAQAVCSHSALFELSDRTNYLLSTGGKRIFTKNALRSEYTLKGCKLNDVKGMIVGYLQAPDAFCVVTTAEKKGLSHIFVCVNTKPFESAPDGSRTYDAEMSVYKTIGDFKDWALDSFEYKQIVSPFEPVAMVPVRAGKGRDDVPIAAKDAIELLLTRGINSGTDIRVEYDDLSDLKLTAPVAAGQEVGKVRVYLNGKLAGESLLVTKVAVAKSGTLSALDKLQAALSSRFMKKVYKWTLIIFAAYLVIVFLSFVFRVVRKYIDAGRSE